MESYHASFTFGRADSDEQEEYLTLNSMNEGRLLEVGRDFIRSDEYSKAELVYNRLSIYNKEIASLYLDLIKLKRCSKLSFSRETNEDKLKRCMESSAKLHREGKIPKADISAIEHLVDNISKEIEVSDKASFNQSYTNFKDYIIQST
jgi:hypothetical protein